MVARYGLSALAVLLLFCCCCSAAELADKLRDDSELSQVSWKKQSELTVKVNNNRPKIENTCS